MSVDVYTIKTEEKSRMKKSSITKGILTLTMMLIATIALVACNQKSNAEIVTEALESVVVTFESGDNADSVTKNLTLLDKVDKVTVTWASSDATVIKTNGEVSRANEDKTVTLTATLTLGEAVETKTFTLKVIAAPDTIAPAFLSLVDGKLPALSHLQTQTVDFMANVTARDNRDGYDVEVTIDYGTYNKDVAGEYTITYTATDLSNNVTHVDRVITVLETLDMTLDAAVIGEDWIQYSYNDTEAFANNGSYGAQFRTNDVLHIMSKTFYSEQLVEHAAEYPTNNGIPTFPYGSLIITDADYNIIHVRLQTGVFLQLDVVDGVTVLTHTDVTWNNGAGGNLFLGIEELIPADGYVMFITPVDAQKGRIFLASNLFYTGYTGGAMTKDVQDIFDITTVELDLIEDYRVLIELPDPIATPVVTLNRHTLSWEAVPNALNYQLFVNGEAFGTPMTQTSLDLSSLDLALSEDDGYQISVQAITKDQFKFSSSLMSNEITYKKIEIQTLAAPVVAVDGTNLELLTWEAVEGTDYYEIYVKLGAFTKLVGETEGTEFEVSSVEGFNGVNGYIVKGIGLATHTDSVASNLVTVDQTVTTTMTFDGMPTEVVVTNATDYFNRRNLTDGSKLGAYIYLVTDIKAVENWSGIYTEAFGTVAVLNSSYQAKFVRNILPKQTYTKALGWFDDTAYAANSAQLVGLGAILEEGDMLLIGKNGLVITTTVADVVVTAAARDFVAYHFINPWAKFPATTASAADGGWRAPMTSFKDASTTVVTVVAPA